VIVPDYVVLHLGDRSEEELADAFGCLLDLAKTFPLSNS
jgi:hypothetical protein